MTRIVKRLSELGWARRVLLAESAASLSLIRVGLRALPFRLVRRAAQRCGGIVTGLPFVDSGDVRDVVWAVDSVAQRFPSVGTCLCQALAAQILLARRGVASEIHIGIARKSGGGIEAHAWLKADRVLLLGGPASRLDRYSSLSVLRHRA